MDYRKYKSVPIKSHEITPERLFISRRDFLKTAGVASAVALLAACAPKNSPTATQPGQAPAASEEVVEAPNSYEQITNYNNYYEFSTDKEAVARLAKDFKVTPWAVEVGGLVNKPATFGVEDLLKRFPQEERIYRLRCVEAWSMVIPWNGFPLADLLKAVEPTSDARYVRFVTLADKQQMPGLSSPFYPWPYNEGLRLDEAMHPLTLLATGIYGKPITPQNGAPIRLVVPWKYGFKSAKSLVKIELVRDQPVTFWSKIAPSEYGFYANVNPAVDHPRWSQASERRIGESGRRRTLMFNGYAGEVASLYQDLDLVKNY